jgi:hypothetical protein
VNTPSSSTCRRFHLEPLMRLLLAALTACAAPVVPKPNAPAAAAPPVADVAPHDHAAPHEHAAPHDGLLQVSGDLHLEARLMPTGVMLWLSDANEAPLAVDGSVARAVIQTDHGTSEVAFSPMGDHLHALATLPAGRPARVAVTLRREGRAHTALFATEAVGMALHDHTALHGGVVGMFGDVHVEYAVEGGELRFYLSDAHRAPLVAGVSGEARVGDRAVPLVFDPARGLLHGEAPNTGEVVLRARTPAYPFEMTFPAGGAPTARPWTP